MNLGIVEPDSGARITTQASETQAREIIKIGEAQ